jgi:four helix bundle protein
MKRDFGKPHQNNPILKLTFEFSLKIIELAECLEESKKYVVANQILKSGTSIGANIHEAQNAESKLDFIHKFKIAAKEANETHYWIMFCENSKNYPDTRALIDNLTIIQKVINKIITSSKNKI